MSRAFSLIAKFHLHFNFAISFSYHFPLKFLKYFFVLVLFDETKKQNCSFEMKVVLAVLYPFIDSQLSKEHFY